MNRSVAIALVVLVMMPVAVQLYRLCRRIVRERLADLDRAAEAKGVDGQGVTRGPMTMLAEQMSGEQRGISNS